MVAAMSLSRLACASLFAIAAGCGDDGGGTPIDAAVVDVGPPDSFADAPPDGPADASPPDSFADAPPPDGSADAPGLDAPGLDAPGLDAASSSVVVVPCAGAAIASEVTAPGFSFTITDSTIAVDAVVRFTMPGSHSVVSGSPAGTADGQFTVGFNATKCLRFTAAGTYPFWCNPHQFTGSITVQ
jgi:plastocyanin